MATTSFEQADSSEVAVYGFAEMADFALRLAKTLDLAFLPIEVHRFPDGETRVRAVSAAPHAVVVRSLNQPNEKLVELVLAASALRDTGAKVITLIAPYIAYMRQDVAFRSGEAVSQKVIGQLLAANFDRFVTVDPHLHRTPSLAEVFLGKPALALSAAEAIGAHIKARSLPGETLLIGPDEESRPWVSAVAGPRGFAWTTATKYRQGDRNVSITLPSDVDIGGRPIVIVDDIISSGGTLRILANQLYAHRATSIEAYTTHALLSRDDAKALAEAGIGALFSCNSVAHPTNTIDLVPTIAEGLRLWR